MKFHMLGSSDYSFFLLSNCNLTIFRPGAILLFYII
jgi:hypothetical protein